MLLLDKFWKWATYDIGIDLGTANTLVFLGGEGIVASEPSVVAVDKKTDRVLAVGNEARKMIGRTPSRIVAARPLRGGVISDFDMTQAMIHYFINQAHTHVQGFKFPRPRVIVGVPSAVTEVERQAVIDASKSAGARQVYIVEEAMAAAIGAGLSIEGPEGNMIVDIGGGTSDIAVLALGDIVVDQTIRVAGDQMDADIINYIKEKYNMLIGDRTAEDVKIAIGSAIAMPEEKKMTVQGRDMLTGLPKAIEFSSVEAREAIMNSLEKILEAVRDAVENTPPELLADLMTNGVYMAGGGALIYGIDKLFSHELKLPVHLAEDPLTAVARGTAAMLDHIELLDRIQEGWEELV